MELIDREKLKSTIRAMVEIPNEVRANVLGAISRAKAVDAAPVVRGWWNKKQDEKFIGYDGQGRIKYRTVYSYYCGRCALGTVVKTNYCPHCGAKMDKEERQ